MPDSDEELRRDAAEVGCFGLVEGRARNLYTQEWFYASQCDRSDGPFICPECASDAVVRKCSEKRDHFAHRARLSPVIGPTESELHNACKTEILSLLQHVFPAGRWQKERTIDPHEGKGVPKLRPDISGVIGDKYIAIEVQASTLTIAKITKRASNYTKRNIALLWLVPLREPLGERPFRPRLYERYLHSIYYGRTYYWWSGQGLTLKPVHYGDEMRRVEYKEWEDDDGNHKSGGGYETPYKIIKKPIYGRDLNIASDFIENLRGEFKPNNERKTVPVCKIYRDRLRPWWN